MPNRWSTAGHQVSSMLALVPLAVLSIAVLFDFAALVSGVRFYGGVAYYDIAFGLVAAMATLSMQLVDVLTAPVFSLARRASSRISAATATMVVLFAVVWSVRADRGHLANTGLLLVELLAVAIGSVGVWLARTGGRPAEPVMPLDPSTTDESAGPPGPTATAPTQARPAVDAAAGLDLLARPW